MPDVMILHNPNCSTSRHAMDTAASSGVEVDVVQYLKAPPDRAALQAIVDKLEDPVADLVRKDRYFGDLGLDAADYVTSDAVIDLLLEHPRLLQRPVLVRGERAIIGRPKDRVEPFLRGD
jgi:arsenate reductase